MCDQEIRFFQETQEADFNTDCEEMFHHSSAANHHPTAAIPHQTAPESPTNTAYNNYAKRQCLSSFQEPSLKRAALNPSSPAAAAADHSLFGFKKLPLPQPFPASSPPPLRRTVSEPIYSTETFNAGAPLSSFSSFSNSQGPTTSPPWQELSKIRTAQESSLPPNPTSGLYRTLSDPNPSSNRQVAAAAATPPRPPLARNLSKSPSCGESPNTKRLKRMKERLREMNQWWNQVLTEGEEEEYNTESENCCCDVVSKEECEGEKGNSSGEAVWIEQKGECLILHFKCPCGNVYQLLLCGNNCFYKLTNFV